MLSVESRRGEASDEAALLEALRAGDERAFANLIDSRSPQMLRVAMLYAPSRAVAEEVVQETWLHVLEGLDRFGQRSTLKTWIFRILANTARSRAKQERRCLPLPEAEEANSRARVELPEHVVLASEVREALASLWVYLIGPLLGAAGAAAAWRVLGRRPLTAKLFHDPRYRCVLASIKEDVGVGR